MKEFFVVANSFAAPFFSDESTSFEMGDTPEEALESFAARYEHPCGLFAAVAYESATAYHKGEEPIAKWLCNHEIERMRLTKGKGGNSYYGHGPGDFEIDGIRVHVDKPKDGHVVAL